MILNNHKSVYFIGIGGIGLSALARYFLSKGLQVAGSDLSNSPIIRDLVKEGVVIHIGHSANNIKRLKNTVIIYSQAVKQNNLELKQALKMKFECRTYPQAVGELTKQFKTIAIAGAHGKSTATAMLSLILTEAELDPTVIVGAKLKEFGNSNFRLGKSEYLVLEADEYGGAFWNYFPFISGITNIDREHLDFYNNLAGIKKSFKKFLGNHKKGAKIIFNDYNENLKNNFKNYKNLKLIPISKISSDIKKKIKSNLKVSGKHNLLNAFVAYSVAKALNISDEIILKAISEYSGIWRRMEFKGNLKNFGIKNKIYLFDDYAHHPSEIQATLQGLREKYPKNALICVFQPHHTHRLGVLFDDFKKAFGEADKTILLPVFKVAGREKIFSKKYTSKFLSKFVKNSTYIGKPEKDLISALKVSASSFMSPITIVMMGAGSIIKYSQTLLTPLEKSRPGAAETVPSAERSLTGLTKYR